MLKTTLTSITALMKQIDSGRYENNQARVYNLAWKNPLGITKNDVIAKLNMSHQTATGVISKLLDIGCLEYSGETVFENGEHVNVFTYVVLHHKRIILAKQRQKAKFEKWWKKAETFSELLSDYIEENGVQKLGRVELHLEPIENDNELKQNGLF